MKLPAPPLYYMSDVVEELDLCKQLFQMCRWDCCLLSGDKGARSRYCAEQNSAALA